MPGRTSTMSHRAYEGTHGQDSCQAVRSSRAPTKHGAKHIQSESGTKGQHSPRPAGRVLLRTVGSLSEQSSKTRTRRVPSPACQPLLQPQHPQPTSPWYLMHIAYPTHAFRRSQQTLALHANIDFTSSSSHPTHQSPSPQPPIQTLSKYARSLGGNRRS